MKLPYLTKDSFTSPSLPLTPYSIVKLSYSTKDTVSQVPLYLSHHTALKLSYSLKIQFCTSLSSNHTALKLMYSLKIVSHIFLCLCRHIISWNFFTQPEDTVQHPSHTCPSPFSTVKFPFLYDAVSPLPPCLTDASSDFLITSTMQLISHTCGHEAIRQQGGEVWCHAWLQTNTDFACVLMWYKWWCNCYVLDSMSYIMFCHGFKSHLTNTFLSFM